MSDVHIVRVQEIIKEVRGDGTRTVEQQLAQIFDTFNLAVRVIDPTVTGSWVGYETGSPDHPCYIAFERNNKPLFGVGTRINR